MPVKKHGLRYYLNVAGGSYALLKSLNLNIIHIQGRIASGGGGGGVTTPNNFLSAPNIDQRHLTI